MNALKGHIREIVLGLFLLVLVAWYFLPAAPPAVDEGDAAAAENDGLAQRIAALQAKLSLADIIAARSSDYDGGGRNLFDYGTIQPPPPSPEELARLKAEQEEREKKQRAAEEEARKLREEALKRQQEEARKLAEQAAIAAAANPPPPAKPVPPPVNLKFIGVLGDASDPIAVFLDGNDFVLAHEGDVVKADFKVQKISYDTLQIGFTDPRFADENRILPMGG